MPTTLAPDDSSKIVITTPDSGVAELQRVLTAYAQMTGYTVANPGPIDGIIGMQTASAVIAMTPRLPGLPSAIRSLATFGMIALMDEGLKQQVFQTIKSNATAIARAVIATAAYQAATQGQPASTPPPGTSAGGKASWALVTDYAKTSGHVWTPVTPTGVPTQPALTIWFYDSWRKTYRVAVPRGTLSGFANYVEVAPSASRPTTGTEVSRGAFFSAVGQWWLTPLGMAAIGVGTLGAGFAAYKGARWVLG